MILVVTNPTPHPLFEPLHQACSEGPAAGQCTSFSLLIGIQRGWDTIDDQQLARRPRQVDAVVLVDQDNDPKLFSFDKSVDDRLHVTDMEDVVRVAFPGVGSSIAGHKDHDVDGVSIDLTVPISVAIRERPCELAHCVLKQVRIECQGRPGSACHQGPPHDPE